MGTVANPIENDEFDIDDGLYLEKYEDTDKTSWPACETVHGWVLSAVADRTSTPPSDKKACVRISYGHGYHVDVPVYIMSSETHYLAHKEDGWVASNAKNLAAWLNEKNDGDGQLKRIIRYLKSWYKVLDQDSIRVEARLRNGEDVVLSLYEPKGFPYELPEFKLDESMLPAYGRLPHVSPTGVVCAFDRETNIPNPQNPGGQVVEILERTVSIISDGIEGKNAGDYLDEFLAYWGYGDSERGLYEFGLPKSDPYILGTQEPESRPYNPTSLTKEFTSFCRMNNLECTFHDLRHTFATMMIANGCDVRTVASYMGHASVPMTLNTYADVDPDAKRAAVSKVEGSFDLDFYQADALPVGEPQEQRIVFTEEQLEAMLAQLRAGTAKGWRYEGGEDGAEVRRKAFPGGVPVHVVRCWLRPRAAPPPLWLDCSCPNYFLPQGVGGATMLLRLTGER